jgi:hypothetical protein
MNEVRTICERISFENKKKVKTRKGIFFKRRIVPVFWKNKMKELE